jgi:cytochrome c5
VSEQVDKSVTTTSVILISGLVLLAVVLFMVAALVGVIGKVAPDDNSRKQAAILERIKPVARVSFEQPKPVVVANLSGSDVYNKVCAACHGTGTLGAPKVGAKDQWQPRFAQGLDTLVSHSVNGLRAMPPKGGAPTMTEANMKAAVIYMLGESGIKVEGADAPAAAPTPAAAAPAAAAPTPAPAAASAAATPTPAPAAAPAVTAQKAPASVPATIPPPPISTAPVPTPAPASTNRVIPPPPIQMPQATPPGFIRATPDSSSAAHK